MKIIGVTGGIASGKSAVAQLFADQGAAVLSADEDARAVLSNGSSALAKVFTLFPEMKLPGGALNRSALGARIFADPQARADLESVTHPAIIARMRSAIAAARASGKPDVLVYEVPLLYERDLAPLFDAVIATLAGTQIQAERLQAREAAAGRPPLTAEAITGRFAAQMDPAEKARRADYVIRTDIPFAETKAQVRRIWDAIHAG